MSPDVLANVVSVMLMSVASLTYVGRFVSLIAREGPGRLYFEDEVVALDDAWRGPFCLLLYGPCNLLIDPRLLLEYCRPIRGRRHAITPGKFSLHASFVQVGVFVSLLSSHWYQEGSFFAFRLAPVQEVSPTNLVKILVFSSLDASCTSGFSPGSSLPWSAFFNQLSCVAIHRWFCSFSYAEDPNSHKFPSFSRPRFHRKPVRFFFGSRRQRNLLFSPFVERAFCRSCPILLGLYPRLGCLKDYFSSL